MDSEQLPNNAARFAEVLRSSLASWESDNKNSVWLKIPLRNASFIEHAANQGFEYHHAESDYVMMIKWLSKTEENKIPISASHSVGVGCIVFNSNNELLPVKEKTGNTRSLDLWKFPTGLLDLGENLSAGAEREVLEETGVRTTFKGILAFRQSHKAQFNKSGMFFLCLTDLVDKNDTSIKMQESELIACEWRDAKEWVNQPFYARNEMFRQLNEIVLDVLKDRQMGTVGRTPLIEATTIKNSVGIFYPKGPVCGDSNNVGV